MTEHILKLIKIIERIVDYLDDNAEDIIDLEELTDIKVELAKLEDEIKRNNEAK